MHNCKSNFYLQQILSQMRNIRMSKKSQNLLRSVESQSRQIIESIYTSVMSHESQKLQFSKVNNIKSKDAENIGIPQQILLKDHPQPFKNLLPFLQHIRAFSVQTSTFILINYNTIHVVQQQRKMKIVKDKKSKGQLRHWLSHIYFSKFRVKLAQQILANNKKEQRSVIHKSEQKQYMPSIFIGKKTDKSIVKKITISKEFIYSTKGEKESEPFCVGFLKNGSQQLFSFTEIVSFIQYPFNMDQITYLQIMTIPKQGVKPIRTAFSRGHQTYEQAERIQKMKRVLQRQQRWRYLQEEYEQLKSKTIKEQNYKLYAQLLTLQTISYLQTKQLVQVKDLALQWIVDSSSNFVISNCLLYNFVSINALLPGSQGLATLYAKKFINKSFIEQIESENKFMAKRTKSQQNQENIRNSISVSFSLKPTRRKLMKTQLFHQDLSKKREKSQVLPKWLGKKYFA